MSSIYHYLLLLLARFPLALCAPTFSSASTADVLQAVGAGFTAAGNSLQKSKLATKQNSLMTNGTCGSMNVIFARGTTEPGNVGVLAGPPFFAALNSTIGGSVSVQGVDYPADIAGFLAGGSAQGSQTMASLVTESLSKCPNSKVVMAGYSQGGQLLHNAATALGATMGSVNSVVIFGDPMNGTAVANIDASKVLVICHTEDDICKHGDQVLEPHLTYSENATEAAMFVAGQSGLGIMSMKRMTILI